MALSTTTNGGGTTTSFSNTPQAQGDVFTYSEDLSRVVYLNVLANDLGGAAKTLWSLDDSCSTSTPTKVYAPADLLNQDTARAEACSSDTSMNGARIWITADGQVGYDAATLTAAFKAQMQALAVGETLTDTFTYAIRLGNGTLSWTTATIQFAGANDKPVITSLAQSSTVQEDQTLTATGTVTSSDVDNGATAAYSGNATGTYGSFAVNAATGVWTYTLDNANHQNLAEGESHTETFTVTVTDDKGATATQDVTITVTGTNDKPVITSGAQTGAVQEDQTLTATGTVTSSDIDNGATAAYTGDATGTYGSFAVNAATGVWTYTLDNANHQNLAEGESHTETFTVTVTDDKGATATQDVTITVTGTNDKPVITSGAQTGAVQEDQTLTATGTVTSSDVDNGATAAYSGNATGTYGSFVVNAATGVWTYTLDNANHQNLAEGESHTETFTVTVTDDQGATATQDVTITVTGTNDKPVITSGAQTGAVQEDQTLTATGTVTSSDVDNGATAAYSGDATGTYGSFVVNAATGVWTYTLDNANHQNLAQGESHTETFTVTVTDDQGATATQDVTITVTGTNDKPVITSGAQTGAVQEDQTLTATGTVTSSDVDNGATAAYTGDATGTYGSFAVNAATGVWTYTLDNANHQNLAEGESHTETFTVTVTDDKGATATQDVTITVTGTNDKPVITSGAQTGAVQEDQTLTATGTVTSSDVDNGATAAYTGDATGTYGSFAVNAATGVWTYTLDNANHQNLAEGESHTETFTVTVTDDKGATATQDVTITVTGTNDKPVITSGAQTGAVQEDQTLTATGTVTSSDVDNGATATYTGDATGTYGSFAVNAATGVWTYTLDNANHQNLAQGESHTETFTVTVTDDQGATATQDVTITVTGSNDGPVITSGAQTGAVQEDQTLTATGTVTSSDVDHGATATYTGDVTGTYGSFVVNAATGVWTYTLDNANHQNLAQGESHTETFTVTVTDDQGATATQDVTITVTGTNDKPVITSGAQTGAVQEDQTLTATGTVTSSDVDNGATATYTGDATGTYGSFAVNATTGVWTYTLDNANHQNLAEGESHTETFTVTVTDDKGATATQDVTITVTGTNDKPVITSGAQTGAVQEDQTLTATGTVTSSDVDNGATAAYSGNATGTYGSFAVNAATGVWTYTLDNANHQNLAQGESHTETFTVTVTDDKGATATQDVTVTITGTNDAPIAHADTGAVNEDATLTVTAANGVIQGTTGGSAADTDVDNATNSLVVSGAAAGVGAVIQGAGVGTSLAGTYGHLTLNADGSYSYLADTANSLATGVTAVDTFTYTAKDPGGLVSNSTTLQITVTGIGDAPVGVDDTGSATEKGGTNNGSGGSNATGNVLTNDTDVDNTNAALVVSAVRTGNVEGSGTAGTVGTGLVGAHGTLTLNANGSYTYVVNETDSAVQALNSGGTLTDSFNYTVNDPGNLTDTAVLTVTIGGANDAPVGVDDTGSATEKGGTNNGSGGSNATGNVLTNDTDVDNTNVSLVVSAVRTGNVEGSGTAGTLGTGLVGAHGTLTLNANGSYTYVVNETDSGVQALNSGGTLTDSFNYTVKDPGNLTDTAVLTITINGANDAAVIAGATNGSVVEAGSGNGGGTPTATGTLTDTDVDNTPNSFTAVAAGAATTNGYGTYGMTAGGVWTYTLDNANPTVNALNNGQTLVDTFNVTTVDGTTQLVTVTINGANDAAVDNTPPTVVSVIMSDTALKIGDTSTLTVTFSEAVTAFNNSDVTAPNGTLTTLTTANGGVTWTATFTPTSNIEDTTNAVSVASTYTDIAGNAGSTGTSANYTIDTKAPTLATYTVTDGAGGSRAATIVFTEAVSDFILADISLSKGSAQNLTTIDNITWSLDINGAGNDPITVSVASGSYTDVAGNSGAGFSHLNPAGIAGSPINLGLSCYNAGQPVTVTVANAPAGWTLDGGTQQVDGSWTITTTDPATLTITTPATFVGGTLLDVTMSWTQADGTPVTMMVADNVEAYAPGSPIFALSGDDHLTGAAGSDLFVFAQPITNDIIHSFDAAADKIDLIGFAGAASFADVQAHMVDDAAGNAVITLDSGETITLSGVSAAALTADNFVFNQEPVTVNAGTMTIGDGAILPLGGTIENTGTIALDSSGGGTDLEILFQGVTLEGGGQLTLSDKAANVIFGASPDAVLTNLDNVIAGAGQLGDGPLTLVNAGAIIANGTNALVIDTGTNIVNNSGMLEATGSGGLILQSGVTNSGTIWANGGNVLINGDVTGTGAGLISGTATLEFVDESTADTTFAESGSGTLKLDHAAGFTGTIFGFASDDAIDLADLGFGTGTTLSYSANAAGTGGTLTVSDGTSTANITLAGQYSAADFVAQSDSANGTLIRLDVSDTFVFATNFGTQEIANFQTTGTNHDVIQFDHSIFADFAAVLANAEQVGSDVVITHAADALTLKNVSLGNLQSNDFHFA